ncbi:hypothetical protein AOLI_G00316360 [Acnodon oligacanthus]
MVEKQCFSQILPNETRKAFNTACVAALKCTKATVSLIQYKQKEINHVHYHGRIFPNLSWNQAAKTHAQWGAP